MLKIVWTEIILSGKRTPPPPTTTSILLPTVSTYIVSYFKTCSPVQTPAEVGKEGTKQNHSCK